MYLVRVLLNKKLMGVRAYEKYEHALPDMIDNNSELYICLPDDKLSLYQERAAYMHTYCFYVTVWKQKTD